MGSKIVVSQLRHNFAKHGILLVNGQEWANFLKRPSRYEFDGLVVNGEGSLHNGSQAEKLFVESCAIARQVKKPIILLNATLENLDLATLFAIRGCALVFVRDSASKRYLASAGIESMHVPDATLTLDYRGSELFRRGAPLITDSSMSELSIKIFSGLTNRRRESMVSLFGASEKPLSKFLFYAKRLTFKLAKRPRRWLRYGLSCSSPEELLSRFASAQGIHCARYHAVCFSIVTKTPFTYIDGNTRKITNLLEDVGIKRVASSRDVFLQCCNDPLAPIPDLDERSIAAFLAHARERNDLMAYKIKQHLERRIDEAAETCSSPL